VSSKEAIQAGPVRHSAPARLKKILRSIPHLRENVYLFKALPGLLSSLAHPAQIADARDYQERQDAWGYSSAWGKNHLKVLIEMLDRAGGTANVGRALDVGCGEGYVSESVAPLCDYLLATEVVAVALNRARERCSRFPQVHFAERNLLTDLPLGRYDLILLMGIIECFNLPRELLVARSKIAKMLEPGGLLLTTATLQHEVFDTAWWTKWLPRGAQRIAEFIAQDPALVLVDTFVTPTHQFVTYRRK